MPSVFTPTHPDYVEAPDAELVRNPLFHPLPLRLLRWIERRYLALEFRAFRRDADGGEDAWWLAVANDAVGPCKLNDILDSLLEGRSPAGIVHVSKGAEVPVPWQTISYRPWWSDAVTARIWTIGFWLGSFVLGWFLVCLAMPLGVQGPAQVGYCLVIGGIVFARWRK